MNPSLKIFIGYDSREKIAFHVLSYSIITNATIPVSITPINLNNLKRFYNRPRGKNESTEFSISRFLTPYLSNFEGYSLYLDCDFIMLENVAKLLKFVAKKSNPIKVFLYISAWVIMPDHWHAIVQVGRYDSLSKVVGRIKAISTRVIHNERLWEGDIWSKAFHDRALRSESELLPLARYIVANPIRAGLAQKAGNYPFWNAVWV